LLHQEIYSHKTIARMKICRTRWGPKQDSQSTRRRIHPFYNNVSYRLGIVTAEPWSLSIRGHDTKDVMCPRRRGTSALLVLGNGLVRFWCSGNTNHRVLVPVWVSLASLSPRLHLLRQNHHCFPSPAKRTRTRARARKWGHQGQTLEVGTVRRPL
jgi:hypothetical protein